MAKPQTYEWELAGFPALNPDSRINPGPVAALLANDQGDMIRVQKRGFPWPIFGKKTRFKLNGLTSHEADQAKRDLVRAALVAALAQLDEIEARLF